MQEWVLLLFMKLSSMYMYILVETLWVHYSFFLSPLCRHYHHGMQSPTKSNGPKQNGGAPSSRSCCHIPRPRNKVICHDFFLSLVFHFLSVNSLHHLMILPLVCHQVPVFSSFNPSIFSTMPRTLSAVLISPEYPVILVLTQPG